MNRKDAGKPVLKDLKEGVVTLPLILAAQNNDFIRRNIEDFFGSRDDQFADTIVKEVIEAGGVKRMTSVLERYVERAEKRLLMLPDVGARKDISKLMDMMYR